MLHDFGKERGIDGMTVTKDGTIVATAGSKDAAGIYFFSPEGKKLAFLKTPEDPSNCCFGGADKKTLYITAGQVAVSREADAWRGSDRRVRTSGVFERSRTEAAQVRAGCRRCARYDDKAARHLHDAPHHAAGAAGVERGRFALGPRGAGDVEVDPRRVADELLQELRRRRSRRPSGRRRCS